MSLLELELGLGGTRARKGNVRGTLGEHKKNARKANRDCAS